MDFKEWKYLYPPRPDIAVTPDRLDYYEGRSWVGQYKKNGTCTVFGKSPDNKYPCMNRHNEEHKAWSITEHITEVLKSILPPDKWFVFAAELLHNKHPDVKNTLYIFDILVADSKFLKGTKFIERQDIINKLFGKGKEFYSHYEIDNNLWISKLITKGFTQEFNSIVDPKLDEGLVLKNPIGILKPCDKPDSNSYWQVKVRYPHKNFNF